MELTGLNVDIDEMLTNNICLAGKSIILLMTLLVVTFQLPDQSGVWRRPSLGVSGQSAEPSD